MTDKEGSKVSLVAMAELGTQISLFTCLPSCALPMNTYSKFPLAQLVVLRPKNYRHNKNPIQQLPINPSYKQMQWRLNTRI
ncbi:hypothetical protein E2C01_007807 [Portunus trituberculatus]|uniref:Uncharacterized protein n=1 Tax=Portunus trituberculatus TaxID=210409 RepID=A0A5B7D263_PORTR|nr:hypothetical protein [Portunus trituberculatus]